MNYKNKKNHITVFVVGVFLLGLLFGAPVSGAPVSAQNDDDATSVVELQEVIKNLQEQIASLQTQLRGLNAELSTTKSELTEVRAELKFVRTLRRGATGEDVEELQVFLSQFPDIYPESLVTGYFGPLTENAVQKWQSKQGIVSGGTAETTGYGQIGPKTREALNRLHGATPATPAIPAIPTERPAIPAIPAIPPVKDTPPPTVETSPPSEEPPSLPEEPSPTPAPAPEPTPEPTPIPEPTSTDKPDLTILDIYDDNGKLSVKIGNIGTATAPDNTGSLYIWIDEKLKWTYRLSTLYDKYYLVLGGMTLVQPEILSGQHTIKAFIDPDNVVVELDENNNVLEKTLSFGVVIPPMPEPELDPPPPVISYPFTVHGRFVDRFTQMPLADVTIISDSDPVVGRRTFSTDASGEFSFGVPTTDDLAENRSRNLFTTWPSCYIAQGAGLSRSSDTVNISFGEFDLVRDSKTFPLTSPEIDLGTINFWPAVTLNISTDIPVRFWVAYPEEGTSVGHSLYITSRKLSNVIPLDYSVRVELIDQAGNSYFSPYIKLGLDHGCSEVTLKYFDGQFQWEL